LARPSPPTSGNDGWNAAGPTWARQYGHLSISDICFRWGFNDPAHFSHAFRDQYQMSPRQYRQQANEASQQTLRKRIQRGWPSGYFETPEEQGTATARPQPSAPAHPTATKPAPALPYGPGRHHHLAATRKPSMGLLQPRDPARADHPVG
jgi:hypothetical protein